MPNDYVKPYNLTENQKNIIRLCIQADGYVPMKGLDDNDVTRLFGYAFIRSPKAGYIAIAARGVAWYMDQVTTEQDAISVPNTDPEVETPTNDLVQCARKDKCLYGNDGWQPATGFSKHSARKNGLQSWCKKCQNASMSKHRKPQPGALRIKREKLELPPPDGMLGKKPYWNCATLAPLVNRKHGSVYDQLAKGRFGGFRLLNSYAVFENGFREAIRYYHQRDEQAKSKSAEATQQVMVFANAITSAEPVEISEALLPFIDTVIVQQKPSDAYAALSLLVEAITCDFQRRANAHEMEVDAYWDRFVPDELRQAFTLAQEYLNSNR